MDDLLQVGDTFRSDKLGDLLHGNVVQSPTSEPYVNFDTLHTENYDSTTVVSWKETKEGGWYRDRETRLSTKVRDYKLLNSPWKVIKTAFTGGGTGHGPHDVYPDGHYVVAQRIGGNETVSFYQSGCFRGMLTPKDITKV